MKHKNISQLVVEYIITRNMDELSELTRYKIADIFGINKNYLSKRFKGGTKMTLFEFINFEKMKRAENLLITRRDLSVKKISRRIGIEKYKQFREKFKKIYGVKPGRYRILYKR